MNTLAIVQARMNSSRLPWKVLGMIGPEPAIYHTAMRVRAAGYPMTIAMPADAANDELANFCERRHLRVFRWAGPEDDVLGRCRAAAEFHNAEIIIRITADCPFIDPDVIRRVVSWHRLKKYGYMSNIHPRRTFPHGLDVEVFSRAMLVTADYNAKGPEDREHVTPWMRRYMGELIEGVENDHDLSRHRWVLDTPSDLVWFEKIARATSCQPPSPTTKQLLTLLAIHPELVRYEPDAETTS